jgi:hypothetical protein
MLAMIAPYPFTKILQCPQLKLFDRTLAASKFRRDLAQTLLTDEAPDDHPPLIVGQRIDELVKYRPLLDIVFNSNLIEIIVHGFLARSRPPPAIRKHVRRNAQKPCHERQAAPFEPRKASQGLVEDIRGHILCFFAVSHAPCDKGVDAFKIVLIQLGKAGGILPRCLNLQPLIALVRQVLIFQRLQSVLRVTSFLIT